MNPEGPVYGSQRDRLEIIRKAIDRRNWHKRFEDGDCKIIKWMVYEKVKGFKPPDNERRYEAAFTTYAGKRVKWTMADYGHNPYRILMKRINTVLSRPKGPDPIEKWTAGSQDVLGFASMRGCPALAIPESWECSIQDFIYQGLGGASAPTLDTRILLERFFGWTKRPVEKKALLNLLVPIVFPDHDLPGKERGIIEDIPDRRSWPKPSLQDYLLDEIQGFSPRERACYLLGLEESVLEALIPEWRAWLPRLVPDWSGVGDLSLPVADEIIAARFGMDSEGVRLLHDRARVAIQEAIGDWRRM